MKKFPLLIATVCCALMPFTSHAQTVQPQEVEYEVGKITTMTPTIGAEQSSYDVSVIVSKGSDAGKTISLQYVFDTVSDQQHYAVGDKIVIYRTAGEEYSTYYIAEKYRIPSLIWIAGIFAFMVILATKMRGVFAFVGLAFSGLVIMQFMLPQILDGKNPFLISTIAAVMILCVSVFAAHGFRPRTIIAAVGMAFAIVCALLASYFAVQVTELSGLGSEEAFMVQFGLQQTVNVQGLLLGGIIIGVLGVLDDVATAQVAAVEELYRANNKLTFRELFLRGFSVGKEHILSLVNTLVLAYAGASLPIFLLLHVSSQPLWVSLNSEPFAEEIIRALVGSMALIVAVPLTTVLAAYIYPRPWFKKVVVD
ncbi:MAG: YibE/F family protein [Candidatus Kerfeldbacteria bacterium]|nr:YibE/F family protein [Candidatus Kerfeldbacteria bacterium]